MTAWARNAFAAAAGLLYGLMWFGGVYAYVFRGGPAAHEAWTAPAFLTLAALIVLVTTVRADARWLLGVMAGGVAAEYAGVRCGCVFGAYVYTDVLRPMVFGVPVVMSAAWMVLVAYVQQLRIADGRRRLWSSVLLAAAWMTAIDLVLDPVASGALDYWRWHQSGPWFGVPLRNFVGWFAISAAMFAVMPSGRWRRNPWARGVGFTVVAFFTIIAMSLRLALPAVAGLLLCLGDLLIASADRSVSRIAPCPR